MKMSMLICLGLLLTASGVGAQVPTLGDLPLLGDLFEEPGRDGLARQARTTQEAVRKLLLRVASDRPEVEGALERVRKAQTLIDEAIALLELNVAPRGQILCETWFVEVDASRETWISPIWEKLGEPAAEWAEIESRDVERLKLVGEVVAAPRILALEGQESVVDVGSRTEMPVLRRTGPGLYELKMETYSDGVRFAFTSRTNERGEIVTEADAKVTRIVGRMPVEAGAKVIGAPRMRIASAELRITTRPGVAALLRLPGEDGPSSTGVVVRLRPVAEESEDPRRRR